MRIGLADKLQTGFPEIMLGLHPGLGGTFRMTRQIDPVQAMTAMLTGKSIYGLRNKKLGLVDDYIEPRHLDAAVQSAIAGKLRSKSRDKSFRSRVISSAIGRRFAAKQMRKQTAKRAAKKDYPAPYALIDLWEDHGGSTRDMQEQEIKSFASLIQTATAQNLIRVFFLQQHLKEKDEDAGAIEKVHVIGAGAMGGDIAAWCAMQGFHVTLSDQSAEPIAQAVANLRKLCAQQHKSSIETRASLDRLIPDIDNRGVEQADLIIEAIPEKLEIKQELYRSIEPRLKAGAILATNTSSIPLEKLAGDLKSPNILLGLHFFNPVSRMQVVEIVSHDQTSADNRKTAMNFTTGIGKLPVAVKSYPGFLVNRALTPYLQEAIMMLDEGIDKNVIDGVATRFGMPMGPVELADQVGLDVCLSVAELLRQSLDQPIPPIPDWVQKLVEEGKLGKKTGQGFYMWKEGKAQRDRDKFTAFQDSAYGDDRESSEQDTSEQESHSGGSVMSVDDITDRLILPMLNACVECYHEGVIEDLDQLDGVIIFATGFAPFRGGPMHYARHRGVAAVTERLEALAETYGDRFRPNAGWGDL
jgi:3-hydroxyacyl-CoA dehydrogenase/enoyl-CoA hydratase/3-hydroxybutyryl-CoA epimerase